MRVRSRSLFASLAWLAVFAMPGSGSPSPVAVECSGCAASHQFTPSDGNSGPVSSCSGTVQVRMTLVSEDSGSCKLEGIECVEDEKCEWQIKAEYRADCTVVASGTVSGDAAWVGTPPEFPLTFPPAAFFNTIFNHNIRLGCGENGGVSASAACANCQTGTATVSAALECDPCVP